MRRFLSAQPEYPPLTAGGEANVSIYKSQILLETSDAGWSENYWIEDASHAAAMAKLQLICTARMGLSPGDVSVRVLRVSDVAIKSDSFLAPATTPTGTYVVVGVTAFDPSVSLQVNGYSADHTAWTHIFVRGIPNDQVKNIEPFQLGALVAPFPANLAAFQTAWKTNAKLYSKKPGPGKATQTIVDTGYNVGLVIRRAGRPFKLRHGRRVIV